MPFQTTNISGQMVLLGTGTSVGVPMIGCGCLVCQGGDQLNSRTRSSAILGLPGGNLLIDTTPDLRQQLLREQIGIVHAVAYTHEHADHLFGLDDLRIMQFYLQGPVPLYCEPAVEQRIRKSFDYAFDVRPNLHVGATPQLEFRPLGLEPVEILGQTITPLRLLHGPNFQVLGFRVGDVAYCTDVKQIPPESLELLAELDTLVLGALRHESHATHMSLAEAVAAARDLAPRQTLFTHISHGLDHQTTNASLPSGMRLARDGERILLV